MGKLKQFKKEDFDKNTTVLEAYHNVYHWTDGWDKGFKQRNFLDMMHLAELTGVPISGTSCLDVGCGTGDLSLFLRKRGATQYLGIDIYEPSLMDARKKYPYEQFLFADLLKENISELFDYAFCSGALTVKLSVNNYDFLESMVTRMWALTGVGVVFNVLTDQDPDPDPDLFFYNMNKVHSICRKITRNAKIEMRESEDVAESHVYLYR